MKYLAKYIKPYLIGLLALLFFVWGQSYVNLILPDYTAKIIDQGIILKNINIIWSEGTKMLLLTILGGLCTILIGFIAAKVSAGFAKRLRKAVFDKIERFSLNEFNIFSSSSLITRATNDVQQIQNVLSMMLRMSLLAPFMGIGAIIKVYQLAPSLSWIILTAICVLALMITILFLIAIPKFTIIQKMVDKLGLQIREMLTGIRVIRAYNNDQKQQLKFDKTNTELMNLNILINRLISMMQPAMTLIMGLSAVAVIWAGAYLVASGHLQIGSILALTQYVSQAIMAFLMISIIFIIIPRATVSVRRINEILSIIPEINDPAEPKHLTEKIHGLLEFKKVDFSYKGSEQAVLSDISFIAYPGQTTAIIGGTGSGKTTLLNLIPRLYDVTGGAITIDGIDIRDLPQHELREYIGYVPQKASLFSGTIKSNVAYGRPSASLTEITEAINTAQAAEFINDLADGLDSAIAQAGNNVSGGQKQRLAIARALVKKPPIFLFDDSFSALDFKTDAALRQALQNNLKTSTIIIVAQRISTIMQADNIIVLDNGKIVGQGKHQDLLTSSAVYREIAESQLSATELKKK
ncbi:MAG: putative ABC transporter ATP-binding protein [Parcubacteria group bacterium ADurb.Bin115]|nr:MAG: putative ABC transporter ATP-binding protein [Parcubacteria group bacterium ADurb.Bin115]